MSSLTPLMRCQYAATMLALLLGLTIPGTVSAQRAPLPTQENLSYGPHERNVLDLWQAKSVRPTPLVVFIHGGGFVQGDKRGVHRSPVVRQCLDAGVSFASINYRFREHAPIQDILRDAARAIQYLRSRAKELNLDPTRIAAYGSSAGAGTSLWLAFHDDLADPKSDDPVLRESSRLTAAGCLDGQLSYDLRDWAKYVGSSPFERSSEERLKFYGFADEKDAESPAGDAIMRDCSMIGLISDDDPPVAAAAALPNVEPTARGEYVHHPKHAIAIGERCKEHGIECRMFLNESSGEEGSNEERRERVRREQLTAVVQFLIDKLQASDADPPAK